MDYKVYKARKCLNDKFKLHGDNRILNQLYHEVRNFPQTSILTSYHLNQGLLQIKVLVQIRTEYSILTDNSNNFIPAQSIFVRIKKKSRNAKGQIVVNLNICNSLGQNLPNSESCLIALKAPNLYFVKKWPCLSNLMTNYQWIQKLMVQKINTKGAPRVHPKSPLNCNFKK